MAKIRVGHWVVAFATLGGCASPQPDVAGDAARLSGIENAIVFREEPAALDGAMPEDRLLTPARAVRMALGRDPRVQAALARVRMAEADAHQAKPHLVKNGFDEAGNDCRGSGLAGNP